MQPGKCCGDIFVFSLKNVLLGCRITRLFEEQTVHDNKLIQRDKILFLEELKTFKGNYGKLW